MEPLCKSGCWHKVLVRKLQTWRGQTCTISYSFREILMLMRSMCIAQGHFQIVLSNEHCPLFQKDLSWFQRLMYCSGVWSYVVGAITAPMFIAIPLITIWAGVFPIVVSWWAAGVLLSPPFFEQKCSSHVFHLTYFQACLTQTGRGQQMDQ